MIKNQIRDYWGKQLQTFDIPQKYSDFADTIKFIGIPTLYDWDDFPIQYLHFLRPVEDTDFLQICGAYGYEFLISSNDGKVYLKDPNYDALRYVNLNVDQFLQHVTLLHQAYKSGKLNSSSQLIMRSLILTDPNAITEPEAWWGEMLPSLTSDY